MFRKITCSFELLVYLHLYSLVLSVRLFGTVGFYRAMHFSAKRGIAIACRLSVRPSVRPSVCDVGEL